MDASPLGRLPMEILDRIITFLKANDDRKSLGCTCRFFNHITLPWVFRDWCVDRADLAEHRTDRHKELQQLADKYGHFVKTLEVDRELGVSTICPSQVRSFLASLPNLHSLSLYVDCSGLKKPNLFSHGYELFEQASLRAPSQSHIFQNLRSLNLTFHAERLCPWVVLFSMPLLEELTLMRAILDRHDLDIPAEFRGLMNLKSLVLDLCFINVQALESILSFPTALVSLNLCHLAWDCSVGDAVDDVWSPKRVYDAVSQQRTSLEKIMLAQLDDDLTLPEPPYPHKYEETGDDFDLSKFPELRVYDGFYLDYSRKFKPRDS